MAASDRTVAGADGISVALPGSLREAPELVRGGIALAAVAEPWPWPDAFRPRLVVETRALAPDSASVPQLSSRLIADLVARGVHVAACDVWTIDGAENGRRIVSLFAAANNTIIRMQYVGIRGGRSVLLTCEHGAGNYHTGAAIFRDAVGTLRCEADDPAPEPDPATMPRLDPVLGELGVAVEDLSGIRHMQRYASAGPPISEQQIEGLRAGRLRQVDTAMLEARGFAGRRGRLTDAGEIVHQALAAPARRVTAEVVADGDTRVARIDLLQRQPGSVVVADPPPGAPAGPRTLDLLATDTTAIALARWLGLAPAWVLGIGGGEDGTLRLPSATLDARLTAPDAPPPDGAADGLARMWAQPWQILTVRADQPAPRVIRVIATPASGYFGLRREESAGTAVLTPLPSELLLHDLLWYGGFDLARS